MQTPSDARPKGGLPETAVRMARPLTRVGRMRSWQDPQRNDHRLSEIGSHRTRLIGYPFPLFMTKARRAALFPGRSHVQGGRLRQRSICFVARRAASRRRTPWYASVPHPLRFAHLKPFTCRQLGSCFSLIAHHSALITAGDSPRPRLPDPCQWVLSYLT